MYSLVSGGKNISPKKYQSSEYQPDYQPDIISG